MKKQLHLFTAALLFAVGTANAQTGIGTVTPDPSAELEVASTGRGFLPPRMDKTQRDAIANPATGLMLFNLTANCLQVNTGTPAAPKWECVSGGTGAGTITSSTGKVWMDKNLGASQVATSATDHLAYGSLYQWGRGSDGHQLINWSSGTAGTPVNGSTTAKADVPTNSLFITEGSPPYDWRQTEDGTLWASSSATNNPCPAGFRLPTETELSAELTAYNITNAASAYASPHKFVLAGSRNNNNASLYYQGSIGYYWTSTPDGTVARGRYFDSTSTIANGYSRASGRSVRCVQD